MAHICLLGIVKTWHVAMILIAHLVLKDFGVSYRVVWGCWFFVSMLFGSEIEAQ